MSSVTAPSSATTNGQTSSIERDLSPPYLMPEMEGTPINEVTTYRSLFLLDTFSQEPKELKTLDSPIDPFDGTADALSQQPAVGVLTVHEQGWVQKGLALGNLLHSVCLAPGEVTQVAVVDWQRRTAGTSTEETSQGEAVTSAIDQSRSVNEVQRAVASEAQSGGSSAFSAAASAQGGMALGGLFSSASASAAASSTTALTAQFSTGSRKLGAESTHELSQRTAETAQAMRSRRAAVVREVSEQEAETLSARVIANYNRRHALNIEYFEVLQLYGIETKLARWDRCLFVPLQLIDFNDAKVVSRHRAALTTILVEHGRHDLALAIENEAREKDALATLERQIETVNAQIGGDTSALTQLSEQGTLWSVAIGWAVQANDPTNSNAAAEYKNLPHQEWLPPLGTDALKALNEKIAAARKTAERLKWQVKASQRDLEDLQRRRAQASVPSRSQLMDDQLALSQALWLRMEPSRVSKMLESYQLDGEPLTSLVEPYPVGVFGNYLAFRWGFQRDEDGPEKREKFAKQYLVDEQASTTSTIAVPTSGVFAEAVLGRGEAAETIDETRLWDWDRAHIPILPPALESRDRAKGLALEARDFASSLAALRATSPEDASHLAELVKTLGRGDMFRDMGGLQQATSLAQRVADLSGAGAAQASKTAAEIQAKMLDTFIELLNSDVGKAAVAEFMLPGAGAAVLGAGGTNGDDSSEEGTDTPSRLGP